jgi:hypothetical protein
VLSNQERTESLINEKPVCVPAEFELQIWGTDLRAFDLWHRVFW